MWLFKKNTFSIPKKDARTIINLLEDEIERYDANGELETVDYVNDLKSALKKVK